MKNKLLFIYLLFASISATFGQGTSKSKIPEINQKTVSPNNVRNPDQEIRRENFPKLILKTSNGQPHSNPVSRRQPKKTIPYASRARTAATYTSTYNGVAYSSDHPYNLQVVYFVPSDVSPDPTYQNRISAMMLYAQEWYRQQMINNGYGPKTFGLMTETANPANVQIIVINGAQPLSYYLGDAPGIYNYPHLSDQTQEIDAFFAAHPGLSTSKHSEIYTASGGTAVNIPQRISNGGKGFTNDIPDFEVSDLDLDAGDKVKVPYGYMMHELGHALNLPHSGETLTESADPIKGVSLMGMGASIFNGVSIRAYLNRAGAAILNSSDTFAEVPGSYFDGHSAGFTNLSATYENGDFVVTGTFQSDKTVTDVNFRQDPHNPPVGCSNDCYDHSSWSVGPAGNSFTVRMAVSDVVTPTNGPYTLFITLVLANGEIEEISVPFSYHNGIPVFEGSILKAVPALCASASPNLAIFSENFESGLGAFTTSHETPSASWEARNWVQATAPFRRAGKVAFGADYEGGDCELSDQSGIISLQSPIVHIPAGTAGNLNMAFDHHITSEDTWDGGNIKYSINGGAWTLLPTSAFTANGYNNSLATTDQGNTNPMQGQPTFTGINGTGTGNILRLWGQSQIDLSSVGLVAGDDIQLRWEMGTDGCGGVDGWYIDDITIYSCGALPVTLVKFEGKHSAEGNLLSWATTAEVNNEYFGVEKSLNGLKFREISRIAGSGNSSVMNTYKFTDSDFQKGISYYRLKQVDTDGTYAYSRIISVDGADLQDLKFFPNPVESLLTIELPDAETKAADVKVFNSVGQQVLVSRKMTTVNGQLNLDLGKLPTGIYQVIMTDGNKVKSISVLKL